jgi:hypothetical protein
MVTEKNEIDFNEFQELAGAGGFDAKVPTDPSKETFHAIYISGQQRKNSLNDTEEPGKLQIRGVRSNLDEVDLIITNVKSVLVKTTKTPNGRENLDCFSYQYGPQPWKGTSGNFCGKNSTERAANTYCNACRSQLVIAGINIDEKTNKPFLVDGKPVYVFIRAKGIKYGNVSNYLSDLSRRDDLEPIVKVKEGQDPEEVKKFERANVNHKRFITRITVGKEASNYGSKDVFSLTTGSKLSVDAVRSILNKSKETMDKFKEKFDWSINKGGSSDYSSKPPVDDDQKFTGFESTTETTDQSKKEVSKQKESESISFDDIKF